MSPWVTLIIDSKSTDRKCNAVISHSLRSSFLVRVILRTLTCSNSQKTGTPVTMWCFSHRIYMLRRASPLLEAVSEYRHECLRPRYWDSWYSSWVNLGILSNLKQPLKYKTTQKNLTLRKNNLHCITYNLHAHNLLNTNIKTQRKSKKVKTFKIKVKCKMFKDRRWTSSDCYLGGNDINFCESDF